MSENTPENYPNSHSECDFACVALSSETKKPQISDVFEDIAPKSRRQLIELYIFDFN